LALVQPIGDEPRRDRSSTTTIGAGGCDEECNRTLLSPAGAAGLLLQVRQHKPWRRKTMQTLSGVRILIVEDEYSVADDLARFFTKMGATILGPAPDLERALQYTECADAAILDINLHGVAVFPVADRLMEREIPFVFFSGYEEDIVPSRLRHVCNFTKPAPRHSLFEALFPEGRPEVPRDDPDDIVVLLPKLRLAARLMLTDENAADRLVERTLKDAIRTVDRRPGHCSAEDWLNGLLREAAMDGAEFLN
jgi:CheY-like chemotaxis protein